MSLRFIVRIVAVQKSDSLNVVWDLVNSVDKSKNKTPAAAMTAERHPDFIVFESVFYGGDDLGDKLWLARVCLPPGGPAFLGRFQVNHHDAVILGQGPKKPRLGANVLNVKVPVVVGI